MIEAGSFYLFPSHLPHLNSCSPPLSCLSLCSPCLPCLPCLSLFWKNTFAFIFCISKHSVRLWARKVVNQDWKFHDWESWKVFWWLDKLWISHKGNPAFLHIHCGISEYYIFANLWKLKVCFSLKSDAYNYFHNPQVSPFFRLPNNPVENALCRNNKNGFVIPFAH